MMPSRQLTLVGAHSVTRSRITGLLPMLATYTSEPGPYGLTRLASTQPTSVMTYGRAGNRLREANTRAATAQPRSTKPVKNDPCRLAHSAVAGGSSHNIRVSLRHSERMIATRNSAKIG